MAIPNVSVSTKPRAAGQDPELLLMGQLDRKLKAVDPEMRKRIILWLHVRHCGVDTHLEPMTGDGSIPFGIDNDK